MRLAELGVLQQNLSLIERLFLFSVKLPYIFPAKTCMHFAKINSYFFISDKNFIRSFIRAQNIS